METVNCLKSVEKLMFENDEERLIRLDTLVKVVCHKKSMFLRWNSTIANRVELR